MQWRFWTKGYVFSKREARTILYALDYTWHRQTAHGKAGFVPTGKVNALRRELRKHLGL